MQNTKLKIFIYTLSISLIFFLFGRNVIKKETEQIRMERLLLSQEKTDKICTQTSNSFKENYNSMNYENQTDFEETENDKKFIEFLKEQNASNASNYLKYLLLRYSLFIVADIILIFGWICYCTCCCNPCCCCKGSQGCCSKFAYMFTILMHLGLIVTGIIGFVYGRPLKGNFIEAGCSTFKMFDHFEYGLNNDYNNSQEWIGLNQILSMLNESQSIYYITNNDNKIISTYNNKCDTINFAFEDDCKILEEGKDIINEMKQNFHVDIQKITESINSINIIKDELKDIEDKYINEVYTYLDDYIIKYIRLYILLFIIIIAFGVLGLITLSLYVHTCTCIKCIYVILWNIETLFMIILVLIGVSFGLINAFSQNIISAIKYGTSIENLNSTKPIIFKQNVFNACFNGDGVINEVINLNTSVNANFIGLLSLKEKVEKIIQKLDGQSNVLKEAFQSLNNIINNTDNLFNKYDIKDKYSIIKVINCRFMKNDINIFMEEINDNLKETSKKMEFIFYASSLCAGISIICGIIVINRGGKKKKGNRKNSDDTQEGDGNQRQNSERNRINEKK